MSLLRATNALILSITFLSMLFDAQLQETSDSFIVECNNDNPCQQKFVSDCQQQDKKCIIDCTKDENICKYSEFVCPLNHDCTLICDSKNGSIKPCFGTILKATESSNINVTVICSNIRACEWMTILVNTTNINLNITVSSNDTNPDQQQQALYIAKHSMIYLPQSGHVNINCYGHSVCHSMKIFGNTTTINNSINNLNNNYLDFNFKTKGMHSFKESYLSLPSNSNIEIICDDDACISTLFDGLQSGYNSNINIECHGKNACQMTTITANQLSKTLSIDVWNEKNNVLSDVGDAEIHCLTLKTIDSFNINCDINIYGNISNILDDINVYIDCNDNNQFDQLCKMKLNETENEWKCCNNDQQENEQENNEQDTIISTALLHNIKGQIALSTMIGILLCLCISVCVIKKNEIHECIYGQDDGIIHQIGGGQSINRIYPIQTTMHRKNKYASLNEMDDIQESEEEQFEEDID